MMLESVVEAEFLSLSLKFPLKTFIRIKNDV